MAIETERLFLRKPIIEDFTEYWLMKNDITATKYTGGITPYDYGKRLALFCKEWVDASQTTELSVTIKSSSEYIGYCGFVDDNKLLYGLKQSVWGNGYGFEAVSAILHYGFTVLNFPYIMASVNPKNVASEKILQKIGMGILCKYEEPNIGMLHKYRFEAAHYHL